MPFCPPPLSGSAGHLVRTLPGRPPLTGAAPCASHGTFSFDLRSTQSLSLRGGAPLRCPWHPQRLFLFITVCVLVCLSLLCLRSGKPSAKVCEPRTLNHSPLPCTCTRSHSCWRGPCNPLDIMHCRRSRHGGGGPCYLVPTGILVDGFGTE